MSGNIALAYAMMVPVLCGRFGGLRVLGQSVAPNAK